MDNLQWANLSSLLANLAAGFTARNPGQENMRSGLEDSAKGSIAAEAAKKEAKKQEKKSKGGIGGVLGSTLGTAAGIALAPATGGLSLAIPAAAGAAGGAIGTAATGGKISTPGVLNDALTGAMAGGMSAPAGTKGAVENGVNMGPAVEPLVNAGTNTFGKARPSGLGGGFVPGPTLAGGNKASAPGFKANQAKAELAPQAERVLAPNKFMANHPRLNRFTDGLRQATLARTNPVGLLTEQATAQGPGQPIVYRAGGKTYVQF